LEEETAITTVGNAIRLSVAPVFLASLFIGAFLQFDISLTVAALFVTAMVSFIAGLLCFLREIFVATTSFRIGPR